MGGYKDLLSWSTYMYGIKKEIKRTKEKEKGRKKERRGRKTDIEVDI